MEHNYLVGIDPSRNLLKVKLSGFFEPEDVAALRREIIVSLRSLSCGEGKHQAVWDISACKIQSQEVVQLFRRMSDDRGSAARRIAIVVGGSLMRMQLARILVDRDVRTFDDATSADVWLDTPAADARFGTSPGGGGYQQNAGLRYPRASR